MQRRSIANRKHRCDLVRFFNTAATEWRSTRCVFFTGFGNLTEITDQHDFTLAILSVFVGFLLNRLFKRSFCSGMKKSCHFASEQLSAHTAGRRGWWSWQSAAHLDNTGLLPRCRYVVFAIKNKRLSPYII